MVGDHPPSCTHGQGEGDQPAGRGVARRNFFTSFTEKIPPISLPYFVKSYLDQPIYKKLTDVLARDEALSPKLMKTETQHLAEIINGKSRTLGGVRIVASSAQCG